MPKQERKRGPDADFEAIERAVRHGDGARAWRALREQVEAPVPRALAPRLANFARRLGRPEVSLRLLGRYVRAGRRAGLRADPAEVVEYAGALIRLGVLSEARVLLSTIPEDSHRSLPMLQALADIAEWNYAGAIPWLERYLRDVSLDDYERLVGRVNLAAALVYERRPEATALLRALRRETLSHGLRLLRANVLELSAQAAIAARRWAEASTLLDDAERLMGPEMGLYPFFLRKWRAILSLERDGATASSLAAVRRLREEGRRRRHWETVRDLDFRLAVARGDWRKLQFLVATTPYESVRKRYETALRLLRPEALSLRCRWPVGSGPVAASLDVERPHCLRAGGTTHRTLTVLSSDGYRPTTTAQLHTRLYPTEKYSLHSSPGRVHQACRRLRRALEAARVPLRLVSEAGGYRLDTVRGTVVLVLPRSGAQEAPLRRDIDWELEALVGRFTKTRGPGAFTGADFAAWAKLPLRTAQRRLVIAVKQGWLRSQGSKRYRQYATV